MHIGGFQKMTVLDYPGRVACTLFTHGCNLRCPFCHNASLVTAPTQELSEEEILVYLRKRRGVLDGICVSGGEPLLQADLPAFLERLKALGYAVKLDTNGTLPARLRAVVEAGLVDYVAMDIKNSVQKYARTVGIDGFSVDLVKESVAFLKSGAVDYEFRTTVVSPLHEVADFAQIGAWIAGAPRYFLQTFTDSGDLIAPTLADGTLLGALSREQMEACRDACLPFVPNTQLRGAF